MLKRSRVLLDILLDVGFPRQFLFIHFKKLVRKLLLLTFLFLFLNSIPCSSDLLAAGTVCKLLLLLNLLADRKFSPKRLKMREEKRQRDNIRLTREEYNSLSGSRGSSRI